MRVVTWNLWWEFTEPDARHEDVARELADLAPDVVLAQEIGPERAAALADRLGATATWGGGLVDPERFPPGPHEVPFGNAVISRWPALRDVVVTLPKPEGDGGTRQLVAALLDEPGGPRWWASVHLTYLRDDWEMRQHQLDRVAATLRKETAAAAARPPILGGDFNMVVHEVEREHALGLGFVDLWPDRCDSVDEITMTTANPHLGAAAEAMAQRYNAVVTSEEAGFCLDYLFSLGAADRAVLGRRTIGRRPASARWPSDHLGVLVDLAD
ncbi:MAG: endonuclease/exonuclease/phosphatase family protein [Actinomycetota bacterium]